MWDFPVDEDGANGPVTPEHATDSDTVSAEKRTPVLQHLFCELVQLSWLVIGGSDAYIGPSYRHTENLSFGRHEDIDYNIPRCSHSLRALNFWCAARIAQDKMLAGVRNLSNGDVELVVEGEGEIVEEFLAAVAERMSGYISQTVVRDGQVVGPLEDVGSEIGYRGRRSGAGRARVHFALAE